MPHAVAAEIGVVLRGVAGRGISNYAGLVTMRKSAITGVSVATAPQSSQARESCWYSAWFQVPEMPARTLANNFFCSGATKMPKQAPEMPNRIRDQRIHVVR